MGYVLGIIVLVVGGVCLLAFMLAMIPLIILGLLGATIYSLVSRKERAEVWGPIKKSLADVQAAFREWGVVRRKARELKKLEDMLDKAQAGGYCTPEFVDEIKRRAQALKDGDGEGAAAVRKIRKEIGW